MWIIWFVFYSINLLSGRTLRGLKYFHPIPFGERNTCSLRRHGSQGYLHGRVQIEGSQPEWCISSMIYSRDAPFWSGALKIYWGSFYFRCIWNLVIKSVPNTDCYDIKAWTRQDLLLEDKQNCYVYHSSLHVVFYLISFLVIAKVTYPLGTVSLSYFGFGAFQWLAYWFYEQNLI